MHPCSTGQHLLAASRAAWGCQRTRCPPQPGSLPPGRSAQAGLMAGRREAGPRGATMASRTPPPATRHARAPAVFLPSVRAAGAMRPYVQPIEILLPEGEGDHAWHGGGVALRRAIFIRDALRLCVFASGSGACGKLPLHRPRRSPSPPGGGFEAQPLRSFRTAAPSPSSPPAGGRPPTSAALPPRCRPRAKAPPRRPRHGGRGGRCRC